MIDGGDHATAREPRRHGDAREDEARSASLRPGSRLRLLAPRRIEGIGLHGHSDIRPT